MKRQERSVFTFWVFLALFSAIKPLASAKEYNAAVYEHKTFLEIGDTHTRKEALQVMQKNMAVFEDKSRLAKEKGADIIVFPEDGLYGFQFTRDEILNFLDDIPDSNLNIKWNPCKEPDRFKDTEVTRQLSCIARNSSIALVANMGDVKYCNTSDPHCPDDGRYQFNTDVAFDKDGTFLAKYHKEHLFSSYEKQFNIPHQTERVTFKTSFGVTFGVFTCFDILFYDPAMRLVENLGVRNIVFTTAWMDGLPTLSSVGLQQAWSRATSVNLLAANQHLPDKAMTGSGIYSNGDPLQYVYDMKSSKEHLLVAQVQDRDLQLEALPGKNRESVDRQLQTSKETFISKVRGDNYIFVKLDGAYGNVSVCANGLCCQASYSTVSKKPFEKEMFAFGAFSGHHKKPTGYYIQACILIKCDNMEKQSCGNLSMTKSSTVFEKLTIMGNFSSETYVFPEVLLSDMQLTMAKETKYFGNKLVADSLNRPLLTAMLFGRTYSLDGKINRHYTRLGSSHTIKDGHHSKAIGFTVGAVLIAAIIVSLGFYYRGKIKLIFFRFNQQIKSDGYSSV